MIRVFKEKGVISLLSVLLGAGVGEGNPQWPFGLTLAV